MAQGYSYNKYIEELLKQMEQNQGSPYQNLKRYTGNVSKFGKNMTNVGDFMKNNFNNATMQNLGSKISGYGSNVSNVANKVNNVISPQNYFKGLAPKPFASLGANGATVTGAAAPVGTTTAGGITGAATPLTTGGTVAGTTAGTAAGTTAATTGATAGTTAATTAGSTAAGTGAAAGGTAAGGAGGAAFSNPVTAIAAILAMAAMGANRKRAKKGGQALLSSTKQDVEEGGDNALKQTQQIAQNMQNQTQDYSQPVINTDYNGITGGASPVQELSPIQEYQEYLRGQGYSDDVINGVPQGLNGGNKDIADWINQYNASAGKNNPINIPQTDAEIAAAKAGTFNTPMQTGAAEKNVGQEQYKQGLLDKFINGISDFSRGYDENRNTAFSPSNLQARQDLSEFKAGINPADYTTKLSEDEQKQFNTWANDMKAKGIINPNDNFQDYDMQGYWKNEVLNNSNLANGSAQNHFTDKYKKPNHETFSNESIYAKGDNARYAGKWDSNGNYVAPVGNNKMSRLGEIAGTISRAAQKPGAQALLAGGLSTALTGNPLYGLGQAYKFGNARAMSDARREALKQYGINLPELSTFGNYTDKDVDSLTTPYYKEAMNNIALAKLQEAQNYHKDMIDVRNQQNAIRQQNANTNATKVAKSNNGNSGKSGGKVNNNKYQLVKGKDGTMYKLDKSTGETTVVNSKSNGAPVVTESEADFRNRVFKNNKNSKNNKGWAF